MFYLKQIQENKSFYPSVLQYASLKENKAVSDTTTTLVSCLPQINNNYLVFSNTNPLLVTRRNETSDQNRGWGKAVPSTPRHAVCGRRTIRHTWILQASIQSLCLGFTGQTLPRQVGWLSLDQEIFLIYFFYLPANLAVLGLSCGMQNLPSLLQHAGSSVAGSGSLTRDQTQAPCIGSTEF